MTRIKINHMSTPSGRASASLAGSFVIPGARLGNFQLTTRPELRLLEVLTWFSHIPMSPPSDVPRISASPPNYSTNTPPPHYCIDPTDGERSIEHTPHRAGRISDGSFIRNRGSLTVLLTQQEDGISSPVYGRMANITGAILLSSSEDIFEVKIQVKCFIIFSFYSAFSGSIPPVLTPFLQSLKDAYIS